jgi:hypothetical protein
MAIKTKEYLAKIRSKTGLSDYKIAVIFHNITSYKSYL